MRECIGRTEGAVCVLRILASKGKKGLASSRGQKKAGRIVGKRTDKGAPSPAARAQYFRSGLPRVLKAHLCLSPTARYQASLFELGALPKRAFLSRPQRNNNRCHRFRNAAAPLSLVIVIGKKYTRHSAALWSLWQKKATPRQADSALLFGKKTGEKKEYMGDGRRKSKGMH